MALGHHRAGRKLWAGPLQGARTFPILMWNAIPAPEAAPYTSFNTGTWMLEAVQLLNWDSLLLFIFERERESTKKGSEAGSGL